MEICIIKSASREVYFQQNLALLSKPANEDMVLRYRSRWVDPSLRSQGILAPARALLVLCDPPQCRCVAIRELTVYHSEPTDEALTLFVRCGPFVSPEDAPQWAEEFRLRYPLAGTQAGHFVLDISDFRPCSTASQGQQSEAWQAVVDLLTREERYKNCFFFFNEGIRDEHNSPASSSELQVGRRYVLRLLSYNPHIDRAVRERAKLRVVTDAVVMTASAAQTTIPANQTVEVALEPRSAGWTRVEVRVPEAGEAVSGVGFGARCIEAPTAVRQAVSGADKTRLAWEVYTRVAALRPDDDSLLGSLLCDLFSTEEVAGNPQIASEYAVRMWKLGRVNEIASLLDVLSEQSIALMTQQAMVATILAACRARLAFPTSEELRKIDLSEPSRWSQFREMIQECRPQAAASILLSVMSERRDVLVDENDLADLLQLQNVLDGFDTTSKVRTAAEWLRDRAEPGVIYRFLLDRISTLGISDVDILTRAFDAGRACQGHNLADVLQCLVSRLTDTGRCDQAVALLLDRQNAAAIPDDEYAYLLARAAGGCTDPATAVAAYIEAARVFRRRTDFPNANRCISCARVLAEQHAVASLEEIGEEQAEIEEHARALQASGQMASADSLVERARMLCRGKRIAIVGGQTRMPWIPELEQKLGTKVDWYPCRRAHRVEQYDALATSVRDKSVAAVVQVRWAPHLSNLKDLCRSWGVPYTNTWGGRDSTLYALAMLAGPPKLG